MEEQSLRLFSHRDSQYFQEVGMAYFKSRHYGGVITERDARDIMDNMLKYLESMMHPSHMAVSGREYGNLERKARAGGVIPIIVMVEVEKIEYKLVPEGRTGIGGGMLSSIAVEDPKKQKQTEVKPNKLTLLL